MFEWLGKHVTSKPKTVVVVWLLIAILSAAGAFSGFGHGNLFDRMYSSESMVPGSESDKVLEVAGAVGQGESIVVLVENISPEDARDELAQFRNDVEDLPHIAQINDPITVDTQFQQQIAKNIDDAVNQALADNQPAIDAAVEQALQGSADVIANAGALGGSQAEEAARRAVIDQATEAVTSAIEQQTRDAASEQTKNIENPAQAFTSTHNFVIAISLEPGHYSDTVEAINEAVSTFSAQLTDHNSNAKAGALSTTLAKNAILDQTEKDLITGEIVSLPIALILLVIVFGGIIAAGLPLGSALVSISIGLGAVWTITFITNVDNFILNIVTLIGLALSIDYGLLIVSRYREEIKHRIDGLSDPNLSNKIVDAVRITIETAGRTVAFSALTIAFAISGLLVMNAPMLRMIAVGGVIVTILAVASAITLVPALIVLARTKIVAPTRLSKLPILRTLFTHFGDAASDSGAFSSLARWVHRRPWPVMIAVFTLLAIIAAPVFTMTLRSNFIEYLPSDSREKEVFEVVEQEFPAFSTPDGTVYAQTDQDNVSALIEQIRAMPNVSNIRTPIDADNGVLIGFDVDSTDPVGPDVTNVVKEIRDLELEYPHYVGGAAALQMDFNSSNRLDAPLALGIVALAVIILLFFMTGSVIAPFTALLINSLSLLAGLGGGAFIFQHGWFGLPQTHGLETFVVASAVAFGFGLAMDYEVFLLARIKEYWDAGEPNDLAVEHGLQRSGRIITSAAAIIIAVFVGFVFGDLIAVKQIGVVLAIIVIVDATFVRLLLVPATMTILGKWNWWAPAPLRKLYNRFGIRH